MVHQQRAATVKVGLLTVIALAVLITTVIWLRGRSLGGGQPFEVYFKDVDGLREGASVQFMGIRVGFVDEVDPVLVDKRRYRVRVRFTISEPDVRIPKGSVISLEQSGIIGEKFVEITPTRPQTYDLVLSRADMTIRPGLPIYVGFREGLTQVGRVIYTKEKLIPKVFRSTPDVSYHIQYRITTPGYLPPNKIDFQLVKTVDGGAYLLLQDTDAYWEHRPSPEAYFTLEEPLRLKEFLEEQLASAEALKTTNTKINQLLSDETIASIQGTLKNSEKLTAKATEVLGSANSLFASTQSDLKVLVGSAKKLTDSLASVSKNVNDLTSDPEMKENLKATIKSVRESTEALSVLLNDPNLKDTLAETKVTAENAADLMIYLKKTVVENDLQGKVNQSVNLLNDDLEKLNIILGEVQTVSGDPQNKKAVGSILEDAKATSTNLRKFSERLNKRFLLFRLMF